MIPQSTYAWPLSFSAFFLSICSVLASGVCAFVSKVGSFATSPAAKTILAAIVLSIVLQTFNVAAADAGVTVSACCYYGSSDVSAPAGRLDEWVVDTGSNRFVNSMDFFPVGLTVVTYRGVHAGPEELLCSFTVTVRDETPPIVICPADLTMPSVGYQGSVVFFEPATAIDAVDELTPVLQVAGPSSGSVFPVGPTVVAFTSEDAAGNSASCDFTILVGAGLMPDGVLTCPPDQNGPVAQWRARGRGRLPGADVERRPLAVGDDHDQRECLRRHVFYRHHPDPV